MSDDKSRFELEPAIQLKPRFVDGVTVFPSTPWMMTILKNETTREGLIRLRREGRLPDYPWEHFKSIGLV
jgi:hypothetical protein